MIKILENIAKDAGAIILGYYNLNDIGSRVKNDGSPVTKADLDSEEFIVAQLKKYFSIPIVTEENVLSHDKRTMFDKYWLVDPLDGTEDFIEKNDEFTVNIALIENKRPIAGVVFAPALSTMYTGVYLGGAQKNGKSIYNRSKRNKLIAADSRHNSTQMTKQFLSRNNISTTLKIGSSLKLCALAEGIIDVYPRFNGTKEWDTAAAHIICNEAGCKLIDIESKNELTYSKETIQNNFFIASRSDLNYLCKQ